MKPDINASTRTALALCTLSLLAHPALASGDPFKDALFSNRTGFLLQVPVDGLAQPKPGAATDGLQDFARFDRATVAELADVPKPAAAEVAKMRNAETGDAAWQAGPDVPAAARLYTAGAIDFAHQRFPEASARFQAILALPWPLAQPRAAWAAFMLGRIALAQEDFSGTQTYFPQVRALVLRGARDDLGLAVASYGEQARLLLRRGQIAAAVALYMAQSTHDFQQEQALLSLQCAANIALRHKASLRESVADPLTRALLLRYAVAASVGDPDFEKAPLLDTVLASPRPDDPADALAALAYANGDYARAEAFARHAPEKFSLWLRAKLALHDGRTADAAALFNQALRRSGVPDIGPEGEVRLRMETGAINVRHGDFVLALQAMWPVAAPNIGSANQDYLFDSFYLADRILTVQELQTFVDTTLPTGTSDGASVRLRDLLARRLARAGRMQDALPYYQYTATRNDAQAYIAAIAQSQTTSGITRAQNLWKAATLMRDQGMEMTGTELWPDDEESGGATEFPFMFYYPPFPRDASEFVDTELQRYNRNAPEPNRRYHYRYIALQHVQEALRSLPARSQAAAAMLCIAATWMRSSHDAATEKALWRQYVHAGPEIPFAAHFGARCPAPDFAAARNTRRHLVLIQAHDFLHKHKLALAGVCLTTLVLGARVLNKRRFK